MNPRAAQTHAVPPKLNWVGRSPSAWFGLVLLGLVGLGMALLVYFFDPATTPFYPGCEFHRLTGLNCPGCGATRALYALLHGRWGVALHDNALFVLTVAALTGRAGWLGMQYWRGRPAGTLLPTSALIPWLVIAMVFGVVRNLPAGAFLSP